MDSIFFICFLEIEELFYILPILFENFVGLYLGMFVGRTDAGSLLVYSGMK